MEKLVKKFITNKITLSVLGVVLFFGLWYLIYLLAGSKITIFPDPVSVIQESFTYFGKPYLYKCIGGSLLRMIIGFSVASILGVLVGMLVGNVIKIKYVLNPTMTALKAVPTAALVYLLMVLTGFENAPIYIVMVIVFPIVYEATVGGYQNIDSSILDSLKVDSSNHFGNNFRVKLPLSMPYILVGLASSFALSLKIEIMAEVITSSSDVYGLGRAISLAYLNQTNGLIPTFAYAFIAILIMLIFSLLIALVKKIFNIKNPALK